MYICFSCKKCVKTPSLLISHFKTTHLLSGKFLKVICEQNNCKQTFTNFAQFKKHLTNIHSSDIESNNYPPVYEKAPILDKSFTHEESPIQFPLIRPTVTQTVPFNLSHLKLEALKISLNLYYKNSMPRNYAVELQNTLSSLFSSVAMSIESSLDQNYINNDLKTILEFCKNPFNEISTEHMLTKKLKSLNLYEDPKSILIDEKITEITSHGNPTLGSKKFSIILMPLCFMFKSIFEIPKLLDYTLENIKFSLHNENFINLANGQTFKKIISQFETDLVIPYSLYVDDFQINNALGSHTYSICGCYINFPLMPIYLLSKLDFIFPAAYISSTNVYEYGNERSFHHLVSELKLLEAGIEIETGGLVRKVHFILAAIVGDNLAVNSILGFVQSFNAKRYCRACKRVKSEMQFDIAEITESLRNETTYNDDLLENDYLETGVKNACIFNNLNYFNSTKVISFDLMHDLYEGVCIYDMCNVLVSLINSKVITLDILNNRKQLFAFGETEMANLSVPLTIKRLKRNNLKMTASESSCFIHFLPLIIGDLIPVGNEAWELLLLLLDIISLLFKSEYSYSELDDLESLVLKHHSMYIKLFGALKPKHHFLVHYATAIKKCGPLKYLWSMRFEAKHKEAKIYFNSITSRKNPPISIAIKNSLKFARFLLTNKSGLSPIFVCNTVDNSITKDVFNKIVNISDMSYEDFKIFNDLTFKGTRYKSNYYVGIKLHSFTLYKIMYIAVYKNEKVFFICKKIRVKAYERHFGAYEIGCLVDKMLIRDIEIFNTPPLHLYPLNNGKTYTRVKVL